MNDALPSLCYCVLVTKIIQIVKPLLYRERLKQFNFYHPNILLIIHRFQHTTLSTYFSLTTPSTLHICTSPHILPLAIPLTLATDEYELQTCRLRELVSLGLQRIGVHYTDWGALACSSSGNTIAIVDSERHLYITNFQQRAQLGKKGKLIFVFSC